MFMAGMARKLFLLLLIHSLVPQPSQYYNFGRHRKNAMSKRDGTNVKRIKTWTTLPHTFRLEEQVLVVLFCQRFCALKASFLCSFYDSCTHSVAKSTVT